MGVARNYLGVLLDSNKKEDEASQLLKAVAAMTISPVSSSTGSPPSQAEDISTTVGSAESTTRQGSDGDDTAEAPCSGATVAAADARAQAQLSLLHSPHGCDGTAESDYEDAAREVQGCPVFSPVLLPSDNDGNGGISAGRFCPAQYGLLGANTTSLATTGGERSDMHAVLMASRIFQNVAAPSSAFICGSQGSGKSHTLSCMLENCLLPSKQGCLPKPLAGVVFHYGTFTSDSSGIPCEAAYLASNPDIKVRVLCAPTNLETMKRTYDCIRNVTVEALQLDEHDLNTQRMLELMGAKDQGLPLYLHVFQRILRNMRVQQQKTFLDGLPGRFEYAEFRRQVTKETLTTQQNSFLQQRLDTLESFMVLKQTATLGPSGPLSATRGKIDAARESGTDWQLQPGQLTIVDLSCPCVTQEQACLLFNICLSLSLEKHASSGTAALGKIIALDEAHKYMGGRSPESQTLTQSLLSTIRLQRHLGARVIISTQEPTISSKLLDLCSVTIVHRFTSPDWLRMLSGHLAGLSTAANVVIAMSKVGLDGRGCDATSSTHDQPDNGNEVRTGIQVHCSTAIPVAELFSHIVKLKVGEAFLFAPSAILDKTGGGTGKGSHPVEFKVLGHEVLKIRVRKRLTDDGGKSNMAA